MIMRKDFYLLLLLLMSIVPVKAAFQPQYSVAGFYPLEHTEKS